jgi:hypothetical protein
MFPLLCFIVSPNYPHALPETNFGMGLVFLFIPNTISCELCAPLAEESKQYFLLKEKIGLRKTNIR